jgi:hypothetical protein
MLSLGYFVIYHVLFPEPSAQTWEAHPQFIGRAEGRWAGKTTQLGFRIDLEDRILVTYPNVVGDLGSHEMGISQKAADRSQRIADLCWKARHAKERMTFIAFRYQHEGIGVLLEDKPVYILKEVRFRDEVLRTEDE